MPRHNKKRRAKHPQQQVDHALGRSPARAPVRSNSPDVEAALIARLQDAVIRRTVLEFALFFLILPPAQKLPKRAGPDRAREGSSKPWGRILSPVRDISRSVFHFLMGTPSTEVLPQPNASQAGRQRPPSRQATTLATVVIRKSARPPSSTATAAADATTNSLRGDYVDDLTDDDDIFSTAATSPRNSVQLQDRDEHDKQFRTKASVLDSSGAGALPAPEPDSMRPPEAPPLPPADLFKCLSPSSDAGSASGHAAAESALVQRLEAMVKREGPGATASCKGEEEPRPRPSALASIAHNCRADRRPSTPTTSVRCFTPDAGLECTAPAIRADDASPHVDCCRRPPPPVPGQEPLLQRSLTCASSSTPLTAHCGMTQNLNLTGATGKPAEEPGHHEDDDAEVVQGYDGGDGLSVGQAEALLRQRYSDYSQEGHASRATTPDAHQDPASGILHVPADADSNIVTHHLQERLHKVEEEFRMAMAVTMDLEKQKNALQYQVELLKDELLDSEEEAADLKLRLRQTTRQLELLKQRHAEVERAVELLQAQLDEQNRLLAERGMVLVGLEDVDDAADDDQLQEQRTRALVSEETARLLCTAGKGPLDVRIRRLAEQRDALSKEVSRLQRHLDDQEKVQRSKGPIQEKP